MLREHPKPSSCQNFLQGCRGHVERTGCGNTDLEEQDHIGHEQPL